MENGEKGSGEVKMTLEKTFCGEKIDDSLNEFLVSSVLYFPKYSRLVVCDCDETFRFIDYESKKVISELVEKKVGWNNHLLQWDDSTFIVSFSNGKVISYSVFSMTRIKIVAHIGSKNIKRMLRLSKNPSLGHFSPSDDRIVCACYSQNPIYIVSYSKCEVIVVLEGQECISFSKLVQSYKFANCFFLSCLGRFEQSQPAQVVKMINFEENKEVDQFIGDFFSSFVFLEVFMRRGDGQEFLIAGGGKEIYIFSPKDFRSKKKYLLPSSMKTQIFFKKYEEDVQESIYGVSFLFQSTTTNPYDIREEEVFLFLGTCTYGSVKVLRLKRKELSERRISVENDDFMEVEEVYDLLEDTETSIKHQSKEEEKDIFLTDESIVSITPKYNFSHQRGLNNNIINGDLKLIVSNGYKIEVFRVFGVGNMSTFEQKDRLDRVEFLKSEILLSFERSEFLNIHITRIQLTKFSYNSDSGRRDIIIFKSFLFT